MYPSCFPSLSLWSVEPSRSPWGAVCQGREHREQQTLGCAELNTEQQGLTAEPPVSTAGWGHHTKSQQAPLYGSAVQVKNHSFSRNKWWESVMNECAGDRPNITDKGTSKSQIHHREAHENQALRKKRLLQVCGNVWLCINQSMIFSCSSS